MTESPSGVDDAAVLEALFIPDGHDLLPTQAAIGPWSPDALHGSAVASLLAGCLEHEDATLARAQFELMAPVPRVPLRVRVEPRSGKGRVTRQTVTLLAGAHQVAQGRGLSVLRTDLDLPDAPATRSVPPDDVPETDQAQDRRPARRPEPIRWQWFGSLALDTRPSQVTAAERDGVAMWIKLVLPVVAGTRITGVQRAMGAADYGSIGLGNQLPFEAWKFPNADLGVQLSREPAGEWIRLHSRGILQPVGVGLTSGVLHDSFGQIGQSSQTLVLARRLR